MPSTIPAVVASRLVDAAEVLPEGVLMEYKTVVRCRSCGLVAPPVAHKAGYRWYHWIYLPLGPLPFLVLMMTAARATERRCSSCKSKDLSLAVATPAEEAIDQWRRAQVEDGRLFHRSSWRALGLSVAALALALLLLTVRW